MALLLQNIPSLFNPFFAQRASSMLSVNYIILLKDTLAIFKSYSSLVSTIYKKFIALRKVNTMKNICYSLHSRSKLFLKSTCTCSSIRILLLLLRNTYNKIIIQRA